MNDPQVVALIYTVEPVRAGRYDNANPLHHGDEPEFDLTVEDKIARFEFKKLYRNAHEAREAIKPYIQNWELKTEMRAESDSFRLRYKDAEIVDRNPLPPGQRPAPKKLRATAGFMGTFSAIAEISLVSPDYPPPPAGGSANLDDPAVVKMKGRYDRYRLGRTTLPDTAYFCVTVLENKCGDLRSAAKGYGISRSVLEEVRKLSSHKGGEDSRKVDGFDVAFTSEERRFLDRALKEIIIRAAQVAADDCQHLPLITKADLLNR